jgi:uncharacterized membrane protein YGL010W
LAKDQVSVPWLIFALALYFARVGLPMQSGVLVSLGATVLMMIFSLSGAALYLSQGSRQ